jgi:hypothetical protein
MPTIKNNTARILTIAGGIHLVPGNNPVPDDVWDEVVEGKHLESTAAAAMLETQGEDRKPWLEVGKDKVASAAKRKAAAAAKPPDEGEESTDAEEEPAGDEDYDPEMLGQFTAKEAVDYVKETLDLGLLKAWKKNKNEKRSTVTDAIDAQIQKLQLTAAEAATAQK